MENNKSIASRWSSITQPEAQAKEQQEQQAQPIAKPAEVNTQNPVRHQYRQTILNGLKGESYV